MSPEARHNTKWLLTITSIALSILMVVITATATITTKFNRVDQKFQKNDSDHTLIIQALESEVKANAAETQRSIASDKETTEKIAQQSQDVKLLRNDVQHIKETVDKIERSIP